jgi:predicted DNA-binding transcriptional regulator AlpA
MAPDALLDSEDIAALLKCSPRYVTECYVASPGFPKAIRLTIRTGKSQPRWQRSDVIRWIETHKTTTPRGGRPRNKVDD